LDFGLERAMNAVDALLVVYDGALNDEWESLASAIKGLTEEESVWQPPAFKKEPHDEGVGRPGTILWYLNHLEMCHRHYTDVLKRMDAGNPPETAAPGELALKQVLPALEKANADLRAVIAALKPEDLTRQARPKRAAASFIAMICAHICWHAGQIKTTRRLCAKR
jgi:hypothetical protein